LRIIEETKVARSARTILKGLVAYNEKKAGKPKYKRFCFTVQDDDGETRGGIVAYTLWNWCFVELLWLDERVRSGGFGHQLLARVEAQARKRGAEHIYLDTFSFQGDGFYQKHGYEVFGSLGDFPPGHHRLWLKKDLL
jgi:GNAT superfamily N-acetyltransferase